MVFFPASRSVSLTAVGHDGSWDWATTDGNLSPTATIFGVRWSQLPYYATDCEALAIDPIIDHRSSSKSFQPTLTEKCRVSRLGVNERMDTIGAARDGWTCRYIGDYQVWIIIINTRRGAATDGAGRSFGRRDSIVRDCTRARSVGQLNRCGGWCSPGTSSSRD